MNAARALLADRPPTGKPLWTLQIEGHARPEVLRGEGDRLYVRSDEDTVYAVHGLTGGVAWKHDAGAALYEPVRHPAGLLLTGCADGRLLALDEGTGEVRWTWSGGASRPQAEGEKRAHYHPQPAVGPDGEIYVGSDHGTIDVLDAQGQPQREIPVTRDRMLFGKKRLEVPVFPDVVGDRLVVTTSEGEVQGLDRTTGERKWQQQYQGTLVDVVEGPRGELLVQEGFTNLHALDPDTGTPRWKYGGGFQEVLDVRVAPGRLLVESCNGSNAVAAVDPDDGRELWRFTGPSGIVAVRDDGTVWAGESFGKKTTRLHPETGHAIGDAVELDAPSVWTEIAAGPGDTLVASYQHGGTICAFAPDRAPVADEPPSVAGDIRHEQETVLIGGVRLPVR